MFRYRHISLSALGRILCGLGAFLGLALWGALPAEAWRALYSLQVFAALGARGKQIAANFKRKSTGVLSPVTLSLSSLGALARVATFLLDFGWEKPRIVAFNALCFSLNFAILLQIFIYKAETGPKESPPANKAKNASESGSSGKRARDSGKAVGAGGALGRARRPPQENRERAAEGKDKARLGPGPGPCNGNAS